MTPKLCRPNSLDALVFEKMARDVYHAAEYVRPGDWVLDVGANVGAFSLFVRGICASARVVCVEPMPDNVRVLRINVGDFAAIEGAAISPDDRPVMMYDFGIENSGCHSMFDIGYAEALPVTVPGVSLRTILEKHGIDKLRFLKLDCQGAEYHVIEAADPAMLARIDVIAMEVHHVIAAGERPLGAIPGQAARAASMFRRLSQTHRLAYGRIEDVDTEQVWVNLQLRG